MRMSQRYFVPAMAALLVAGIALVAACGRNGGAPPRVAQHVALASPTATDTDVPASPLPFVQIIATLGPTPFTTPGDSSAATPTPPPPRPTHTPVRPTPTNLPPTATSAPPTATATPTATPVTNTITITINGTIGPGVFTPGTLTVQSGSKIIWHNATQSPHTATQTTGPTPFFDTSIIAAGGDSAAILFTTPGTYTYQCAIHPSMTGTIIVT
ncbi:MAG TPA: plastocyanin/azurin family copper-binding protein [Ktedonobacterales bacterium]|nr:plastocyanin/azurin family copper-binding protein [Ktedonobacterales bacterium]